MNNVWGIQVSSLNLTKLDKELIVKAFDFITYNTLNLYLNTNKIDQVGCIRCKNYRNEIKNKYCNNNCNIVATRQVWS